MMEIARATTDDIPQLCVLLDLLFEQETEFTPEHERQAHGLHAIMETPGVGDIFLARRQGQVIGMVSLLYSISTALGAPVALLEDMVIAPDERGSGTGSALITHALEYAEKKGCKRITLLTDHDNVQAQRFYQKQGFERSSMFVYRKMLDE
jgi:ribosomal protein S18 acetylase RimI-like enzyme